MILGINKDSIESHKKFSAKYNMNFALLSDPDGTTCAKYGACAKDGGGGVARTTFIIDEEGKIAKIYTNVRAMGHAQKVLANL